MTAGVQVLTRIRDRGRRRTAGGRAGRRDGAIPYLFILPHTLFFAAFLAWPFLYGIWTSLFEFDFLRPEYRPFVGLDNYLNLITPGSTQYKDFWRALGNTAEFLAWSVAPLVLIALLLAILLNGRFRGRGFFRALFFAPYTLSVTTASVLWWWIFQPRGGLLNHALEGLGLPTPNWLSHMPEAWFAITLATVWWTIGFNTIIFLAALQNVPATLYEAAAIDGASPAQQLRHVTVPMLRPVLILVITITLIASANLFGQALIMTGGGPLQQTESMIYRIYVEGIQRNKMGSAAAMSVVMASLLLVISAANFRLFGRGETE